VAAFRRAGWYVDRILKGMSVAELPINFMDQYELVINPRRPKPSGSPFRLTFSLAPTR